MNNSGMDNSIWISKADAEHHAQFLATGRFADGRDTPSPIEVVQHEVMPPEYLDKFQSDSQWYEEIEKFKMDYLVNHVVYGFYQLSKDDFIDEMQLKSLDQKTVTLIWHCFRKVQEEERSLTE